MLITLVPLTDTAPYTSNLVAGLVVPMPILPLSKTLLLVIVEAESNLTK